MNIHVNNLIHNRDATGKFPEYPTDEEGGSSAIFTQKDPAEVIIVYFEFFLYF